MATIPLEEPTIAYKGPVFLAAGFRPFFLAAGLHAALMLPLWLVIWMGGIDLGGGMPPAVWHGHEMIFGFGGAAVAGFLLTAVPNWTNARPVSGRPLLILFALWLGARIGFTLPGLIPLAATAAIELAFLPLLGVLVGRPLIKAGKRRNMIFLAVLAAFWLSDILVIAGLLTEAVRPMTGNYLGMAVLLVLIVVIGGRIIPSFTQTWLTMQGRPTTIHPIGWLEKGGVQGVTAVAGLLAAFAPNSTAAGVALLAAGGLNLLRLSRWHGLKTLSNPILWVLHLGYKWLAIGLILLGASSFIEILPPSAAVHALTAGAIATMILGVMSRATLGHSGRPLVVHKLTVAAYVLVSVGAALRVVAPVIADAQVALTHAGGAVWALAWIFFVVVYAPIVLRPRADGRPG